MPSRPVLSQMQLSGPPRVLPPFSIQSPAAGRFGCFHIVALVNNASVDVDTDAYVFSNRISGLDFCMRGIAGSFKLGFCDLYSFRYRFIEIFRFNSMLLSVIKSCWYILLYIYFRFVNFTYFSEKQILDLFIIFSLDELQDT